jgi:hypothetical protein
MDLFLASKVSQKLADCNGVARHGIELTYNEIMIKRMELDFYSWQCPTL